MDFDLNKDQSSQTLNEELDRSTIGSFYNAVKAIFTFVQLLFTYVSNGFNINLDKKNSKIWQNTSRWRSLRTSVILFERKHSVPKRFLYLFVFLTLAYVSYKYLIEQENTAMLSNYNEQPRTKEYDINLNIFYINREAENFLFSLMRYMFTFFIFVYAIGIILILIYHFNKQNVNYEIGKIWCHLFEIIFILSGIAYKVYKYFLDEIGRGLKENEEDSSATNENKLID
jgi:hypothetical protein